MLVQVHKLFSGKPKKVTTANADDNLWDVNGSIMTFPNKNIARNWGQPQDFTLEQIKNLVLEGKTIRFGCVSTSTKKPKNTPLYNFCQPQEGGYIDLDDLLTTEHDRILTDLLFNSAFLINYSFSTDFASAERSSHACFNYSRPLLVQQKEHQKVIKSLYHYLDSKYKLSKEGKFDSACFDPTRLKFGTKNEPERIIKFDSGAVLDVDIWLEYYEKNKSSIEKNNRPDLQTDIPEERQSIYLEALKQSTKDLVNWNDPNSFSYYPGHNFTYRADQSDDLKDQWDGYDFRGWSDNPGAEGRSASFVFTIEKTGNIYACARGNANQGYSFTSYLVACYRERFFSQYQTFENFPEKESKAFYDAIQDYFNLKFSDQSRKLLERFESKVKVEQKKRKSNDLFLESKTGFNRFWNNDQLVDLEALEKKFPFAIEQKTKEVDQVVILPIVLAEVFLSFYKGRIKLVNNNQKTEFLMYLDTEINGKVCYFWHSLSESILKSKISQWIRFYYGEALKTMRGEDQAELLFSRCKTDLMEGMKQLLCTLEKITPAQVLETDDHLIPFTNGLYCLSTKKLYPFSPDSFTRRVIPFDYSAEYDSSAFDYARSFFRDWFDTSEDLRDEVTDHFLDMVLITWTFQAEKLKMIQWFVGESNSGKNEKIEALMSVMNPFLWKKENQFVHRSNWDFTKVFSSKESADIFFDASNRFASIGYTDRYWTMFDEVDNLSPAQLGKLKSAVGTDTKIRAEQKGGSIFNIPVKCMHTFLSENDPQIPYNNKGGLKRLQLFKVQPLDISRHLEYKEKMSDPEFLKNLFLYAVNQDIEAKVKKLQKSEPEFMKQTKIKFQEENNPYVQFVSECLEKDDNFFLTSDQLFTLYSVFSNNQKLKPVVFGREFIKVLKGLGFEEDKLSIRKRVRFHGGVTQLRVYEGLKFSEGAYEYNSRLRDPELLIPFPIKAVD
jgi:phage/plasmid-associated DNA primase